MTPDPSARPPFGGRRSDFPVRLAVFEGPLDLLLALVERNDLPISGVSLVAVTEQFLAALDDGDDPDLDAIAGYLVVAAKLMYLKSVWLLPRPPAVPTADDDPDPLDAAEALAQQVREYRRFKQVAEWLRQRERDRLASWPRRAPPSVTPGPRALAPIPLAALVSAMVAALRRAPTDAEPLPERVSVAERVAVVRSRLAQAPTLPFTDLLPERPTRDLVIATLLAVLDLVRQREADVQQDGLFAPIVVTSLSPRGPS